MDVIRLKLNKVIQPMTLPFLNSPEDPSPYTCSVLDVKKACMLKHRVNILNHEGYRAGENEVRVSSPAERPGYCTHSSQECPSPRIKVRV